MALVIESPRSVGDRKRLAQQCAEAGELKPILAEFRHSGESGITRRFLAAHTLLAGKRAAAERAYLIDQLIRTLYDTAILTRFPLNNPTQGEHLAIFATGGYGRGELAPFSDIDLLFLQGYRHNAWVERVVEFILYALWDVGLKPGYAIHTVKDALTAGTRDHVVRTAQLDARFLCGDAPLRAHFQESWHARFQGKSSRAFRLAKIAEAEARHARFGESRYLLEPHLKEGKGGLRDIQLLRWLEAASPTSEGAQTLALLTRAEALLWTLRWHLHLLARRAEERIAFEYQPELARKFGIVERHGQKDVERMMRLYFRNARWIGQVSQGLLPLHRDAKPARGIIGDDQAGKSAESLLCFFERAQSEGVEFEGATQARLRQAARRLSTELRLNPRALPVLLRIMRMPRRSEYWLTQLSEAGILGRLLPDFGRVVGHMQFDMYHHFTVDDHSIGAIGQLHDLLRGEFLKDMDAIREISAEFPLLLADPPEALFIATLFHDIAKGREGDHSVLGADIVKNVGPLFGLSPEATEIAAWLVRHHLLMSTTAFRRNLDDPKTIADFREKIPSRLHLQLLLLLTIADIRAVGPRTWNSWKAQLLGLLYKRATEEAEKSGGSASIEAVLGALEGTLQKAGWTGEELEIHRRSLPADYLHSAVPVATLARQAELVRQVRHGRNHAIILTQENAATILEIATGDRPGLVEQLAGALALAGMSIWEARIATLRDSIAIDTFAIVDAAGSPIIDESRRRRMLNEIEAVLHAPEATLDKLRGLGRSIDRTRAAFPAGVRIAIENNASAQATLIEVAGRDRRGLVFDLARVLGKWGCSIAAAKIATFGHRAIDSFYITRNDGKLTDPDLMEKLREDLRQVLEGTEQSRS
ncbi:MAG TPA: HD domain-containing protein [Dongiaceae bacterium]|jgi:[protein-PII] uridylyltransferase|nr:HD domain-containing protein [Dongiaceae bacterium]